MTIPTPVECLAEKLLIETVRAMATACGLLSDEGVRESVRQARVFYAELETATPRAVKGDGDQPSTARTVDDGSDGDIDASGLADLLGARRNRRWQNCTFTGTIRLLELRL